MKQYLVKTDDNNLLVIDAKSRPDRPIAAVGIAAVQYRDGGSLDNMEAGKLYRGRVSWTTQAGARTPGHTITWYTYSTPVPVRGGFEAALASHESKQRKLADNARAWRRYHRASMEALRTVRADVRADRNLSTFALYEATSGLLVRGVSLDGHGRLELTADPQRALPIDSLREASELVDHLQTVVCQRHADDGHRQFTIVRWVNRKASLSRPNTHELAAQAVGQLHLRAIAKRIQTVAQVYENHGEAAAREEAELHGADVLRAWQAIEQVAAGEAAAALERQRREARRPYHAPRILDTVECVGLPAWGFEFETQVEMLDHAENAVLAGETYRDGEARA